jgi:AraC-like DNA-binding protein
MDDLSSSDRPASDNRLSSLKFDSAASAPEQAFARWREELSAVFDVAADSHDCERGFNGSIETYHLGGLLLTNTVSGRQRFQRTHRTVAHSGIDHYLIQAHRQGGFQGAVGDREFSVGPGDICVFDLSQPCATLSTDFNNVTLCLPRTALAPLVADPDALHGLVLPAASAGGILLTDHLFSLFRAVGRLPMRDAMAVSAGSLAFVGGCLTDATATGGAGRAPYVRAALAGQVRRFIDRHLCDPELGPESVTAALGVSRATLFRMFEASGGVSAYIRKSRLTKSLADLRAPGAPLRIVDIALKWGFRSETTYSRAFRAVYGFTPSEFRAGAEHPPSAPLQNMEDLRLGHWVRSLALP